MTTTFKKKPICIKLDRSRFTHTKKGMLAMLKLMQDISDSYKEELYSATMDENEGRPMLVYTLTGPRKDLWWCAEYMNLPGVVGTARTMEEAIYELKVNAEVHIVAMKEENLDVPQEYL